MAALRALANVETKRERGLAVAAAGAAALAALVVWRFASASYRGDVAALCDAERRSGFSMETELPALTDWVRGHLTTPEGQTLFSRLEDVPVAERAAWLRAASAPLGIAACATADGYERLGTEGACRAELQGLCSYVTFPGLADEDDEGRLAAVEGWIADHPGPCASPVAAPLREAASPAGRAAVLRAAAARAGVLSCDVAKVLRLPPPLADAGAPDASGGD